MKRKYISDIAAKTIKYMVIGSIVFSSYGCATKVRDSHALTGVFGGVLVGATIEDKINLPPGKLLGSMAYIGFVIGSKIPKNK